MGSGGGVSVFGERKRERKEGREEEGDMGVMCGGRRESFMILFWEKKREEEERRRRGRI